MDGWAGTDGRLDGWMDEMTDGYKDVKAGRRTDQLSILSPVFFYSVNRLRLA